MFIIQKKYYFEKIWYPNIKSSIFLCGLITVSLPTTPTNNYESCELIKVNLPSVSVGIANQLAEAMKWQKCLLLKQKQTKSQLINTFSLKLDQITKSTMWFDQIKFTYMSDGNETQLAEVRKWQKCLLLKKHLHWDLSKLQKRLEEGRIR